MAGILDGIGNWLTSPNTPKQQAFFRALSAAGAKGLQSTGASYDMPRSSRQNYGDMLAAFQGSMQDSEKTQSTLESQRLQQEAAKLALATAERQRSVEQAELERQAKLREHFLNSQNQEALAAGGGPTPQAAAYAKAQFPIGLLSNAGLEKYVVEKTKTGKYQERDFALPNGKIQKQASYDHGQSWQPVGASYNRRDPYIIVDNQDEKGAITRVAIARSTLNPDTGSVLGSRRTPDQIIKDNTIKSYLTMQRSMADYRATVKRVGRIPSAALGFPSDVATDMKAKAGILRMGLKELLDLGALVGADFAILDSMIVNPGSALGIKMGPSGILKQLDAVKTMLNRKLEEKGFVRPKSMSGRNYNKMSDAELGKIDISKLSPAQKKALEDELTRRGL